MGLHSQQIRAAPVEVRHWIERELNASLGLEPDAASAEGARHEHLVACNFEEAAGVLSLIQGMFPVVNVFFEFGRQAASVGREGLEALRLIEIVQHARLPGVSQVIGCMDIINEALRRVREDKNATLFVLDKRGGCIIAAQTQQSIARLWQRVIGEPEPSVAQLAEPSGARQGQFEVAPSAPLPHGQDFEQNVVSST